MKLVWMIEPRYMPALRREFPVETGEEFEMDDAQGQSLVDQGAARLAPTPEPKKRTAAPEFEA